MTRPLARLEGVVKRFGRVVALDGADLEVRPGEVHGVLGENGAGKSTLLNILGGLLRQDAGLVEVGGRPVTLKSPRDAWAAGVGLVHQHFTLVPALTVLENLALGRRTAAGGLRLPYEELRREIGALMERTGLEVPLDAAVAALGVGTRQRVEILKALLRRPRILVLDEPTAVLTPVEVERFFGLLRQLAAEGDAVVLVAHKLDEVLSVADALTILRRGRTVLRAPRGEVDAPTAVRAMVGADAEDAAAVGLWSGLERRVVAGPPGEVVARVRDVRVTGSRGEVAIDAVSLEVRRGEIVGIAGVEGNGQRELSQVLAGRLQPGEGSVETPAEVAFISQDRTREGVVGAFDLAANAALVLHRNPEYLRGPLVAWERIRTRTRKLMEHFDVRAAGPDVPAAALSGGNQQRLVVARELEAAHDLLVAENPTRGLDVASTSFVHEELVRTAASGGGPGVVLVSTDLDEVLALAHRILVMVRGRLTPVPEADRTRAGIGRLMLSGADRA